MTKDRNDQNNYVVMAQGAKEPIGRAQAENEAKQIAEDFARKHPNTPAWLYQRIGTVEATVEAKWK